VSITSAGEWIGFSLYPLTEQELSGDGPFDGFGYMLDPNTGKVTRTASGFAINFIPGVKNVIITYVAGRATYPANVVEAAKALLSHWWQQLQAGAPNVMGAPNNESDDSVSLGYAIPNRVMELLKPNRRKGGMF
jgi:hypothetical protein